MVRCSVRGCKSDSERKISGLSFHTFPDDPNLRMVWINATGRINWEPKNGSKICSQHFKKQWLRKKRKRTFLHPDAVPVTLNEDLENYYQFKLMKSVPRLKSTATLKYSLEIVPRSLANTPTSSGVQVAPWSKNVAVGQQQMCSDTDTDEEMMETEWLDVAELNSDERVGDDDDEEEEVEKTWREVPVLVPSKQVSQTTSTNNEVQEENPLGDCSASIKEEFSVSSESSPPIQCIEAGEDAVATGSSRLDVGSSRLDAGSSRLDAGSSRLGAGSNRLDAGSSRPDAGSSRLDAGSSRLDAGSSRLDAGSSRLGAGYRCDQCFGDIVTVRYCCVECRDYALCGACEARGHHAAHYVLRVPWGKPHVEVQAVLENIRNFLFQKEDDDRCELEPEVKVEAPEPAPGPDPLAPAASSGPEDQNPAIVKTEDLDLGYTEVKLELTDEESQETSHSHLVPAVTQPTVPSTRGKGLGDVAVYSGDCTVYTHRADPAHGTGPDAPDPTPRLVPQRGQGIDLEKGVLSQDVPVVQTVKKDVPSTAKRKTNVPSLRQAKVKKVI